MTNCSRAGGCAGSNYPFLTLKERDIETGLDYFGARYYASTQGRFTGTDPYDINYERQETTDKDKADELFTEYIGQPQHWNHYAYALNNPLKYVDPDGRLEYQIELFGKRIWITISDKIDKKAQEAIKKEIDNSIATLNANAGKITNAEMRSIKLLNAIYVGPNKGTRTGMNEVDGVFNLRQKDVGPGGYSGDFLTGAIIHDSFHIDQDRRGLPYNRTREKEASAFAVGVAEKIGLDKEVVDWLKRDAVTGHFRADPFKPKTRSRRNKTP